MLDPVQDDGSGLTFRRIHYGRYWNDVFKDDSQNYASQKNQRLGSLPDNNEPPKDLPLCEVSRS